jgi:hypothetical protein
MMGIHGPHRTLAAILNGSRSGEPWGGMVSNTLVAAAREHDVGPLVYRALHDAGAWERQPSEIRNALAQLAGEAALLDELRVVTDRSVIATLAGAGLKPLIFKGAALAHRLYAEPWLRPRVDTDLLFPERERSDAAAVFAQMGFTLVPRPTGEHVTHQCTYVRLVHGVRAEYDVHWKIADPQVFADVLSYDELARDAVPVPHLGSAARSISDVHAWIIACTHRVAHHYDSELLVFLYDIDLLSRRLDEASWDRVIGIAAERQIRGVCARGLGLAADLFDTPVPPRVVTALNAVEEAEPTAKYLRHRLRRVDILRSDLHALGGWRVRAQLVREHLLPPPGYILASYGQTRMSLLPALYIHRILRGAREWFRPLR